LFSSAEVAAVEEYAEEYNRRRCVLYPGVIGLLAMSSFYFFDGGGGGGGGGVRGGV
jgi:hypothetical protein